MTTATSEVWDNPDGTQTMVTGTSRTASGQWHAFLVGTPSEHARGAAPSSSTVATAGGPGVIGVAPSVSPSIMPPVGYAWAYRLCIDVHVQTGSGQFGFVGFNIEIVDDFTQQTVPGLVVNGPTPSGWPPHTTYDHTFGPIDWPVVTPLAARLSVQVGTVTSWSVTPASAHDPTHPSMAGSGGARCRSDAHHVLHERRRHHRTDVHDRR